jgi:hypothetical protein
MLLRRNRVKAHPRLRANAALKRRRCVQPRPTKAAAPASHVAGSGTATRLIDPLSYCKTYPAGKLSTESNVPVREPEYVASW